MTWEKTCLAALCLALWSVTFSAGLVTLVRRLADTRPDETDVIMWALVAVCWVIWGMGG